MDSPKSPVFSLQSALTVPSRGPLFFMLRPVIVLRNAVRRIYEFLIQIIVAEFRGRSNHYSSGEHLASIAVAAVLAIGFYHFKSLEEAVVLGFFLLWSVEGMFNIHLGVWSRQRVVTNVDDDEVRWRRYSGREVIDSIVLQRKLVSAAVIEPEVMIADAFGRNGKTVWRVKLLASDAEPIEVSEYSTVCEAVAKGTSLARKLAIPITIPNSKGMGPYAGERKRYGAETFSYWETERHNDQLILTRDYSPLRALRTAFAQNGILFFVVILADILSRIGFFLSIGLGLEPGLGGSVSFTATEWVMLMLPEADLVNGIELSIASVMLVIGFRSQLRKERLRLHQDGVSFSRTRQPIKQLRSKNKISVVKLDAPEEGLLFISEEGQAILIDELAEEYLKQPFVLSLSWLTKPTVRVPVR